MNETQLFSRLNELPRLKTVLQELLEMVNSGDADFGKLAEKMTQDQLLSARLLRMANSAHFGGAKNISSINDAMIRVGSGAVRTLVVASVLSGAFPKLESLDLKEYWSNTFEVATIGSKVAPKVNLDPNEVFTASILHNIGELMIHSLIPEEALKIEARVKAGENRYEVQKAVLGTTSPALGAKLAKSWKFPDELVDAISHFLDPENAQFSPQTAYIISFSRDVHDVWDELSESQKETFLTEHPSALKLNINSDFAAMVDKVRGNGRDLAEQLA